MVAKHDYYTLQYDGTHTVSAYGWSTYERNSVLAGQPKKQWLESYDTEEDARKDYPDAQFSSKWTEPQVSLNHLPGPDDYDPQENWPNDY